MSFGDCMNYFLDTNVIIGYIFSLDYLNINSNEFISFENYHYYSVNVKEEVELVYVRNQKQYRLFLLILMRFFSKFSDNTLINENRGHGLIDTLDDIGTLKTNQMHTAFNIIWKKLNFNLNHDAFEVKKKFSIFSNDFHSDHALKNQHILDKLILVSNHTKKDQKILDKIRQENLNMRLLHKKDEDILFDANEFSKENPQLNLKFVSADKNFIKAINILMDYLSFSDCVNLHEFENN